MSGSHMFRFLIVDFFLYYSPNSLLTSTKRLCPLLNGSRPRDQNPDDTASFGQTNAPVAASFVNLG